MGVQEGQGGFFGSRAQVICGGSLSRICIMVLPVLRYCYFLERNFSGWSPLA